jgi:transposase
MIPVLSGTAPAAVRVLIATRPVDFRRGADGLAATVQSVLRQDPFSGTIFVFRWGSQVAIAVVGIEKFRLNTWSHVLSRGAIRARI